MCQTARIFVTSKRGSFLCLWCFLTVHTSLRGFRRSLAARIPEAPVERACISCFCLTVDQNEIQLFSMSYVLWHIVKLLQSHSSCSQLSCTFFFPDLSSLLLPHYLSISFVWKHTPQWGMVPQWPIHEALLLESISTQKGQCMYT